MKRISIVCFLLLTMYIYSCTQNNTVKVEREKLVELLGYFPQKPELNLDTLEKVRLDNGWRYRIKYLAEPADFSFNFPEDWVYAYLFIPDHEKGAKLPAVVAIHQDDIYYHIGKDEPAGLQGDSTMFYGLDLYNRGYVVICPDRYYHAERRMFDKTHGMIFLSWTTNGIIAYLLIELGC